MASGKPNHDKAKARVGERHGRLVVTEWLCSNKYRRAVFQCACDCGSVCIKASAGLTDVASCGCWTKERQADGRLRHGHSKRSGASGLYHTWQAMNGRCSNPNNQDYTWYGAKGIKVCEAWQTFDGFNMQMGASWFPGATIDRIDPNDDYTLTNCRWLARAENARRSANARHVTNRKRLEAMR